MAQEMAEGEALLRPMNAELKCNLDDMTPEAIGAAVDTLFEHGALEVFLTPIYMKKNRPGTLLTCICAQKDAEKFARLMLLNTTTTGVRETAVVGYKMAYAIQTVQTSFGPVRVKYSEGAGIKKSKPEYEDILRIARQTGLPFDAVVGLVRREIE